MMPTKKARPTARACLRTIFVCTALVLLQPWRECVTLAQEKKPTPPPSRLPAAPDTTTIGEKPKPKPTSAEKSRLELPDVLIVGRDRSKRLAGEKVYAKAVSVELQEPAVAYRPVRVRFDERGQKAISARELVSRLRGVEGLATYGDYRWLRAEAVHWAQYAGWSYQFSGHYSQTKGQFNNSGWERWGLEGRVGIDPESGGHADLRASVFGLGLEMNTPVVRRSSTGLNLGGHYSRPVGRLQIRVTGSLKRLWLNQTVRLDSLLASGQDPRNWDGNGGRGRLLAVCEWETGPVALTAGLRFIGDRFNPNPSDTLGASNDLTSLFLEINLPVAQRASLAAGASLETLRMKGRERQSRGFVNVRAAGALSSLVGLFAEFRTGYRLVNPEEIWSNNPYFKLADLDWGAERIQPSFGAGAELKFVSGSRVRFRWNRSYIHGAHYWHEVPDTALGGTGTWLFGYRTIPKLERNEMAIGFDFHPGARSLVSVELLQVSEELETAAERALYPGFTRRPFLAHWRLPVRISWRPVPHLRVGLVGAWVGQRPRDLAATRKLSAYTSLDLDVDVAVSKNVMIRTEAHNLSNQRIVLWPGHPEFGRVLALGVHGVW